MDYSFTSSIQSVLNPDALSVLASVYSYDTSLHALAYKPVAKKVCAILAPLDEEFRTTRSLPDDPLSRLKPLPLHPPNFIPGVRFTQECTDNLDLDPTNWLWPDKVKLIHWIVLEHEMAFAWIPTEHGCLDERYFPPVKIPTVPHTPWVLQNIPIPLSMWADTIQIIKEYNLQQEGDDRKHCPNHFGSIGLSDVEGCYSQAKLELYGLFRAL